MPYISDDNFDWIECLRLCLAPSTRAQRKDVSEIRKDGLEPCKHALKWVERGKYDKTRSLIRMH